MDVHELRKRIDAVIFEVEKEQRTDQDINAERDRALSLIRTKLQEAKMWAGKVLEAELRAGDKPFAGEGDYCTEREDKMKEPEDMAKPSGD